MGLFLNNTKMRYILEKLAKKGVFVRITTFMGSGHNKETKEVYSYVKYRMEVNFVEQQLDPGLTAVNLRLIELAEKYKVL